MQQGYVEASNVSVVEEFINMITSQRAYEANTWIAASLFAAFERAKRRALGRLSMTGAPKTMLPFLHAEVDETLALFGPDPWPDGVDNNRQTLEKAVQYMLDDGLIDRRPTLDEIFVDVNSS